MSFPNWYDTGNPANPNSRYAPYHPKDNKNHGRLTAFDWVATAIPAVLIGGGFIVGFFKQWLG